MDSAPRGEELCRGCLLPSAVRLFWCKLKILQEQCVEPPQPEWWGCSRSRRVSGEAGGGCGRPGRRDGFLGVSRPSQLAGPR